jgi:hypothetical protein
MNGYASDILAQHQLNVPGRNEAAAPTDDCPSCLEPCKPASVLDEGHGHKVIGRIASYRCRRCDDSAWLCLALV